MNLDLASVREWLRKPIPGRYQRGFIYGVGFVAAVEFVASVLTAVGMVGLLRAVGWFESASLVEWLELFGDAVVEFSGFIVAVELGTSIYRHGFGASGFEWAVLGIVVGAYVLAAGLVGFGARALFSRP